MSSFQHSSSIYPSTPSHPYYPPLLSMWTQASSSSDGTNGSSDGKWINNGIYETVRRPRVWRLGPSENWRSEELSAVDCVHSSLAKGLQSHPIPFCTSGPSSRRSSNASSSRESLGTPTASTTPTRAMPLPVIFTPSPPPKEVSMLSQSEQTELVVNEGSAEDDSDGFMLPMPPAISIINRQ